MVASSFFSKQCFALPPLSIRRSWILFRNKTLLALGARSPQACWCSGWIDHAHMGFPPQRTPIQNHVEQTRLHSCPGPDQDRHNKIGMFPSTRSPGATDMAANGWMGKMQKQISAVYTRECVLYGCRTVRITNVSSS